MNFDLFFKLEPYCYGPMHVDKEQFKEIGVFIKEALKQGPLYASIHRDYSSSARFELAFSQDWKSLEPIESPNSIHFKLRVSVSHRGPFIISCGYELQPRHDVGANQFDITDLVFRPSDAAEAKAREIAQAIAKRFGLTYLNGEWLKQIKLNYDRLSDDAKGEIDDIDDEPNALSVLFAQYE
jgi:hypothetical protein